MMTNFRGTKNPFQDANSGPELLGGYWWVPVVTGGYRWVPMGTGGYWWVPVGTGGYRWVPVGTGGHWLSLSITLLQTQIVTNLDCYKLKIVTNSQKIPGPKT